MTYPFISLTARQAYPVHPSFRIIALANPPAADSRWLTSETLALFSFHYLPSLRREAAEEMVAKLFPRIPENVRKVVMNVYEALGESLFFQPLIKQSLCLVPHVVTLVWIRLFCLSV